MAKVTDLNTVQEFARQCIEDNGTQLLEFLTMDAAVNCFTMIYMTNDLMNGFAQDFENNISVISSPKRIAIIYQAHHSCYVVHGGICEYNAIEDDMNMIRVAMDAALDRWEEGMV